MGFIRRQLGSESPRRQVEEWFVKYAKHPVMSGTFYHPDEVLFKVNTHWGYVMTQLIRLYLEDKLNKFVMFDFCNSSYVKINTRFGKGVNYIVETISQMDKHLLNLNEIIVYDYNDEYKSTKIKRYGEGDWRVEH